MTITIYHNPDCGTSRNVLSLIRQSGEEPEIIEYLKTPPTAQTLACLVSRMGVQPRALLRQKEAFLLDKDMADIDGDQLLERMAECPALINRPIVISPLGARLCRPSDGVLDILSLSMPLANILKEDGTPFLKTEPVAADDQAFVSALKAEGLVTCDLEQAGCSFFACKRLDNVIAGYAGYELHGENVLIRSVVVLPFARHMGFGRHMVPLLLLRASEAGARQAWLLTETAAAFFSRAGFSLVERGCAPEAIRQAPQFSSLCAASAALMTKKIVF